MVRSTKGKQITVCPMISVSIDTPTFNRLKVSRRPRPSARAGSSSGDISIVSAARAQPALLAVMAIAAAVASTVPDNVAATATFRLTRVAWTISGEANQRA